MEQIAAWLSGALALGGSVVAAWKYLHIGQLLHSIRMFLEDWNGEEARPGRERIPSFPERMAGLEQRTKQLEGNGGSHLADDIRKTAADVVEVAQGVTELRHRAQSNRDAIDRLDQRISDHRRRNEQQVEHLKEEVDRRFRQFAYDHMRSETYRAALVEFGIEVEPQEGDPEPTPPTVRQFGDD